MKNAAYVQIKTLLALWEMLQANVQDQYRHLERADGAPSVTTSNLI